VKHLQAVLIALGSSLVASALILQSHRAIAIGILLGTFLVFFVGLHLAARGALPGRPQLATKFIAAQWLGLVGLAVLAGGVPLWLSALLPKRRFRRDGHRGVDQREPRRLVGRLPKQRPSRRVVAKYGS
jgi:hypothetical protein